MLFTSSILFGLCPEFVYVCCVLYVNTEDNKKLWQFKNICQTEWFTLIYDSESIMWNTHRATVLQFILNRKQSLKQQRPQW